MATAPDPLTHRVEAIGFTWKPGCGGWFVTVGAQRGAAALTFSVEFEEVVNVRGNFVQTPSELATHGARLARFPEDPPK